MDKLRIVYLGTPDFAVEPLKRLIERQRCSVDCAFEVVGVVTMPDKVINKRGTQLLKSPVKQYAEAENLPVLQPESLKNEDFLSALASWRADLQIVVAFRMLPESVWNMPRLGTFNLHASLLPQYRGAAPINWAVINGDKESGVTTFFLKHAIDTGDIIMQKRVAIEPNETAGTLHDKLMYLGGDVVLATVDAIVAENVKPLPQTEFFANENELRPAPKIFRDTCRIDWNRSLCDVYNLIRGMSPYPAAWTELKDIDGNLHTLKVYEASVEEVLHDKPSGMLLTDGKTYLKIATPDGYVSLLSLQLSGKKRMSVADLLRGFNPDKMVAV